MCIKIQYEIDGLFVEIAPLEAAICPPEVFMHKLCKLGLYGWQVQISLIMKITSQICPFRLVWVKEKGWVKSKDFHTS